MKIASQMGSPRCGTATAFWIVREWTEHIGKPPADGVIHLPDTEVSWWPPTGGLGKRDMRLIEASDYDDMSRRAAEVVAEVIRGRPDTTMVPATGNTPVGLYEELVRRQ